MKKKLYMQNRIAPLPVKQIEPPKPAEANRINMYTCWTCGGTITTIDRHEGVTPAMLACRATEGCDGTMHSHRYTVDKSLTPEWEWFKPMGKIRNRDYREYVQMGGLEIRRIKP